MQASSATHVDTPQTRFRAAIARCDITPPVGIYHRMWGAATRQQATAVHRPLTATLLWLEPAPGDSSQALVIAALDHCILDQSDLELMRDAVGKAAALRPARVLVTLSHTHAAGLMSRSRANLPGGEFIGPYLDEVAGRLATQAAKLRESVQPATIVYGAGRCNLAAHRDFYDEKRQQFVCGYNPTGPADDTVLAARIIGDNGLLLGTVVNYACHPTTLAWQNTLISPDYLGAMREVIEQHTSAPCLFLQGASADLGPREGFVGDCVVADRNGRQLAFAALSAIESLPPAGTRYVYSGPVVSGAMIGVWGHRPLDAAEIEATATWRVEQWTVPLSYRSDLPTVAQALMELSRLKSEAEALPADCPEAREIHARVERARRQAWRLEALPPEAFPLSITLAHLGNALWVFVAGEHYQSLQTTLRQRYPNRPIIVATLAAGWQPGYIPPADLYGRGIYQEQIAVVAAGSAERVLHEIAHRIASADS